MPANQPKAQHFVQLAYLEAFCPVPNEKTGTSFLWVHAANQPVRRQVPRECAVENYFYCHEQEDGQLGPVSPIALLILLTDEQWAEAARERINAHAVDHLSLATNGTDRPS